MTRPVPTFLAVTTVLVAFYLLIVAGALDKRAMTPGEDAVAQGAWVAFGVAAIVAVCCVFEVVRLRLVSARFD
ncbi:hypothetical protein [Nocardioides sp. URHA0020]|uniref:hypothetical protein n=1 Tax=Nocardioides sp. URHA0020 TaxID=1380392 RepID=UPI0004915CC7|nr:hypothetical protein [Nocardioides sp. URHA0020]